MTPEKEDAIKQVRSILNSQFDSWIISCKIKDENLNSQIIHDWHGDVTDVVGLIRIADRRIVDSYAMRRIGDD